MDRCNGHSEEAWSAPRNGQGLHKVFEHYLWLCLCLWKLPPTIFLQIWVLGVLDVQRGVLRPDQTISKPGNEKTYLWRQLSPGGQPHSYEQVAQRGYVTLYQDIDLLLKRSKNVPKKSSFLKRDLDARKDSEAYRYFWTKSLCTTMILGISIENLQSILHNCILPRVRFCLPVGEKLDGRVECFLFTPFNKKYRFV